jgi:hypothetical protein
MRALALSLAAVCAVSATGCLHITTKVPGVLDLRSDAAEVPANPKPPTGARDGFDSILKGDGVQGKDNVTLDDRKYWVIGLIPLRDDSGTELIQNATGDGGVLRNVTIGEQFTLLDSVGSVCVGAVGSVCVIGSLVGLVLPPVDFKVTGVRGKAASASAEPPPPAAAPGE